MSNQTDPTPEPNFGPTPVAIVPDPNPLAMIDRAVTAGYRGEDLKYLYDLFREWTKDEAGRRFAEAITAFQAECPPIQKRRQSSGKTLQFDYASYDDVDRIARPIMAKYGIVATYTTEPTKEPPGIMVTCRIRVGIHQEPTTITVPIPQGTVNATQLMGQAVTYAKRYALCAALNIVVTDEDTDGGTGGECVSDVQLEELDKVLDECQLAGFPVDQAKLFAWISKLAGRPTDSFHAIPASRFGDVLRFLNKKRRGEK